MRGFLVGSLALIALQVAVGNPRAARAAEVGSSWSVSAVRRLLSPDVAGIPQRKGT